MNIVSFVPIVGEEKIHVNPNGFGGTGYGIVREGGVEKTVCYDCCGKHNRADMSATEPRNSVFDGGAGRGAS